MHRGRVRRHISTHARGSGRPPAHTAAGYVPCSMHPGQLHAQMRQPCRRMCRRRARRTQCPMASLLRCRPGACPERRRGGTGAASPQSGLCARAGCSARHLHGMDPAKPPVAPGQARRSSGMYGPCPNRADAALALLGHNLPLRPGAGLWRGTQDRILAWPGHDPKASAQKVRLQLRLRKKMYVEALL